MAGRPLDGLTPAQEQALTALLREPTIARAKEIYLPLRATWREQKSCFEWPTGARLYFRYLDRDADADAYQGHDYTRVYVEELTQFADPRPIEKLKATLRSAQGAPTGFRATCNPGGPGHTWVKARYIDVGAWRPVRETFQSPFGGPPLQLTRLFIPAKLTDNPICAAASSCQGFCRAELQMFRTLLGEKAEVERVEHLLSGARRCAYRIRSLAAA